MALFTSSDISARLSTTAYQRLYARNGGSTVDATFLALMVAETESRVNMLTAAAFPAGFDATGGTVDVAIVGACVDICNGLAASRHPSASENGAYALAQRNAEEFLRKLKADQARPVTSAAGPAKPRAGNRNETDENGEYTNPYSRSADGKTFSGF